MGMIWKLFIWCVLLVVTVSLSVMFGPVGFIIGLLLCWIQHSSFSRREMKKQHKEMLEAIKKR